MIFCPGRVHSLKRQIKIADNFLNSIILAKIAVCSRLSDRIEARVIVSPGESQKRNFHKDDVDCVPFKSQQECGRTVPNESCGESRRCEKAWRQELVSIGASVDSRGAGGLARGPILDILMLHTEAMLRTEVFGSIALLTHT